MLRAKLQILDAPTEGVRPSIINDIARAKDDLRGRGKIAILPLER